MLLLHRVVSRRLLIPEELNVELKEMRKKPLREDGYFLEMDISFSKL